MSRISQILVGASIFATSLSHAQNIHNSNIAAVPLMLNPAFAGMIDGNVRGNIVYRNDLQDRQLAYKCVAASADAPVLRLHNGDYLGAGIQVVSDKAGDGDLKNFMGDVSVSYHKLFGRDSAFYKGRGCDLAFGIQGGYIQTVIDVSEMYFGGGEVGNFILLSQLGYPLHTWNSVNYYRLNAGVSFAQSINKGFSYVIGVHIKNLNQPNDAFMKYQNKNLGLDLRYVVTGGCDIRVAHRFRLRPAIVVVNRRADIDYIAGNEFQYQLSPSGKLSTVHIGLWYRSSDVAMFSAGVNLGGLRFALNYDYMVSTLNSAGNGSDAIEAAIGFTVPRKATAQLRTPCTRF